MRRLTKTKKPTNSLPKIIPRSDHIISRDNINPNALKVLYRLKNAGFAAYLVGGGVRDLLLEITPKDFDIATDAQPEEINQLFRNCILIGRRFRLAHIHFHHEIIEVATFRAASSDDPMQRKHSDDGMILRDNVYGTLEEDAWRRDFTINALYYNIRDFSVVDYTGGMDDLQRRVIRVIGDPEVRYHEDPVRMLRAVRLAAKLGFKLDQASERPIAQLAGLLQNVPSARLFEEINKWFYSGKGLLTFNLLRQNGLFAFLFPQTEAVLGDEKAEIVAAMVANGFINTDDRVLAGKPLNSAFLLAVLLWCPLQRQIAYLQLEEGLGPFEALLKAMNLVLSRQQDHVMIPQRLRLTIKEIWVFQYRFQQINRKKIEYLFTHRKFRIAYDFLLLRAKAGEDIQALAVWWTSFQEADGLKRKQMIAELPKQVEWKSNAD